MRRSITSGAINILALFLKKGVSGTICKIRTLIKPKRNTNAHIRLDLGTPVSKSVNLHFSGTCSQNPKCFMGQKYGPATLKQHCWGLKKFQIQGAREVFSKRAMSTVIGEATLGDVGWMSVRSQILEIKLRFYSYLCRLPKTRLAKQVVLLRKLEYTNPDGLPNPNTPDNTKSWFHDIQNGFELLKLLPIYANTQAVGVHSNSQWNKLVHKNVLEFDKNQLL
jgi:hypothetical protein